jgi:2-succinyl-5-enolpyruvyl-6-hydroxy-3-cyclohexene-1-carboxylate synthase
MVSAQIRCRSKEKTIKTEKNNVLLQILDNDGGGIFQDLPLDVPDGPKGDFVGPA